MQKYVLGFMFSESRDKVILIKKLKPKWQEGFYNGVGGKVEDFDSDSHDAIVREFREETSVNTNKEDWKKLLTMEESNTFSVDVFYIFTDKYNEARTVEIEEVNSFDIDDDWNFIRFNSISNVPWLIMACLDYDCEQDRLHLSAEYS